MPSITNKAYDVLLSVVEQLAAGARKHRLNTKVAASLDAEELVSMKTELEELRKHYLQEEQQARLAYDKFKSKFTLLQKQSSNDVRILKGIFGPKAIELVDFGIMPEKSKSVRHLGINA